MKVYSMFITLIIGINCLDGCSFQKNKDNLKVTDIEIFENTLVWELAKAVKHQNIRKINKILKNDKSLINYKESKYDTTLLMWAVRSEKYESAKELLELGADPDISSKEMGGTALFPALDKEDIKYEQLLLDYKADTNVTYCVSNDKNIIKSPYECGVNSLIYTISSLGSGVDKVKLLVNHGADINYKTKLGNTAAIQALFFGDIKSAYYLIVEKKADIKATYYFNTELTGIQNDKPNYPIDLLLEWVYPLDSKESQMKVMIIEEFKKQGVDYNSRKKNLSQRTLNQIQKLYPNNWQEYLEKY